jgi:hypothetical protein
MITQPISFVCYIENRKSDLSNWLFFFKLVGFGSSGMQNAVEPTRECK